eukprot:CAMPEP_0181459192 /NCGR_PEP_ID=MMETSP1110-20121109/32701_1 /TAXON_ID=174948 /ORGANISM="Symbiodinium sp., Strain CCMP421" /LENGTH=81 /DNA_ID=CAMNT_0023583709 /DNA_START=440 /DNA_END=685 /DNA_ORIENTATION=-
MDGTLCRVTRIVQNDQEEVQVVPQQCAELRTCHLEGSIAIKAHNATFGGGKCHADGNWENAPQRGPVGGTDSGVTFLQAHS